MQLIIAPDSSSNDYKQHAILKERGIDIVVLDHHMADEGYSENAIVVNNQLSQEYPNKSLCGAGVVYKFCCAFDELYEYEYANKFVDLAATGLIGDMMELLDLELRMQKTIEVFEGNLSEIRAGRANPAILNKVKVDYYGVPTPINQMAGISVPEARMIVIQPWDMSVLKDIEKAILASDIGINPNNDGKVIRLAFPELNEERRKEIVKDIRKIAEEAKVAIRSIRRDGIDEAKSKQKNSEITEDELKSAETETISFAD